MKKRFKIIQLNLKLIVTLFVISFFINTSAQVSNLNHGVKGYWQTPDLINSATVNWKAQWIWLPKNETSDMMLARKNIRFSKKPSKALLRISASSKYKLYVNGKLINQGPARSASHHQSYDILDISSVLQKGENLIAVKVHYLQGTTSYHFNGRAGLLVQLNTKNKVVFSNNEWKVTQDFSWSNDSKKINRFQLFVNDKGDLSKTLRNWNQLNFDDSQWKYAEPLLRNVGWPAQKKSEEGSHITNPWTSLVARDIPYLNQQDVEPIKLLEARQIKNYSNGIKLTGEIDEKIQKSFNKKEKITLTPTKNKWLLLYDFGEAKSAMSTLEIKGPLGTKTDIYTAAYTLDNRFTHKIMASNFHDQLILSGKLDNWQANYFKPSRYVAIVVSNSTEDVIINSVKLHEISYPFSDIGKISSKDFPWVQDYWEASKKTIKAATTDAYTDNYREKRQYAQTGYYAALGNYFTFGDFALQRRYLLQIAQEQEAGGLMPAYAPASGNDFMVILDSNCLWIRSLYNYYLYSGDDKTVKELIPYTKELLKLLDSYTNESGLIEKPPYAYWLDHTLNDRRGANLTLNGHYAGALEDFSKILADFSNKESYTYLQKADQIKKSIRTQFWNVKKGLFVDALIEGKQSNKFSEHANAMALATQIATKEQANLVAKHLLQKDNHNYILRENGMTMVTPAMSYFLHKGLAMYGYEKASLEMFHERFKMMLHPTTNKTLWEEWWLNGTGRSGKFVGGRTRSDAQTESVFPPALFTEYLLGIQVASPGLKKIRISKPAIVQEEIKASLPVNGEVLEVAWRLKNNTELYLTIPNTTKINLDLSSMIEKGKSIVINNKKQDNGLETIYLEKGSYRIIVK